MAITTKDADADLKPVFTGSFQEPVEGLEGESVVALVATRHDGEEGKVVSVLMHHQMVVAVAEKIAIPVGIIAPFGGGRSVMPIMLTAIDSLRAAGACGFSIG